MANKIYRRTELKDKLDNKAEKKLVFTNGCFDLLHTGHVRYLKEAKGYGDLLVIGLNSDSSVRQLKGENRPLLPESERAEMLASLEVVDYVTIFSELTAEKTLSLLKPEVYVKGGDYTVEELPEAETVKEYGGEVELVPEVEGVSTTELIDRIISRYA